MRTVNTNSSSRQSELITMPRRKLLCDDVYHSSRLPPGTVDWEWKQGLNRTNDI